LQSLHQYLQSRDDRIRLVEAERLLRFHGGRDASGFMVECRGVRRRNPLVRVGPLR
jgi:hypothetical protein